jgi:hypothetical protein
MFWKIHYFQMQQKNSITLRGHQKSVKQCKQIKKTKKINYFHYIHDFSRSKLVPSAKETLLC